MTDALQDATTLHLSLHGPEETAALATYLAPGLVAGDVLLLNGPIGAGKSHFSRRLIQSRLASVGRMEDVPSPTFTLVQVYDLNDAEIWHADLYRLGHVEEVIELGLDEAFDTAICLVEWPERLGGLEPRSALRIDFRPGQRETERELVLTANNPRWSPVLAALGAGKWKPNG